MKRDDPQLGRVDHAGGRTAPPGGIGLEGHMVRRLLRSLGDPPIRFTLWNGESVVGGDGDPVAGIRIGNRRALLGLLLYPELNFGDAYRDGSIEVEGDLVKLLARFRYEECHRTVSAD